MREPNSVKSFFSRWVGLDDLFGRHIDDDDRLAGCLEKHEITRPGVPKLTVVALYSLLGLYQALVHIEGHAVVTPDGDHVTLEVQPHADVANDERVYQGGKLTDLPPLGAPSAQRLTHERVDLMPAFDSDGFRPTLTKPGPGAVTLDLQAADGHVANDAIAIDDKRHVASRRNHGRRAGGI